MYGERPARPGAPTVLLYGHYDVQPAGVEDWTSPPFEPVVREGRLYGRGAADDKAGVVMHLAAIKALDRATASGPDAAPGLGAASGSGAALGPVAGLGIKVLIEGAEEVGSGGIEEFVRADPALIAADAIVVGDVGNYALGEPTLTTSLRGMVKLEVSVETLAGPVHSGMYGGPAPDALVALIASAGQPARRRRRGRRGRPAGRALPRGRLR